jgi:hypothetical protein
MVPAESMTTIQLVAIAGAGGFIWNMMDLWEDGKKPFDKRTPKDLRYWIFFVFWPCAGASLAWLYTGWFDASPAACIFHRAKHLVHFAIHGSKSHGNSAAAVKRRGIVKHLNLDVMIDQQGEE